MKNGFGIFRQNDNCTSIATTDRKITDYKKLDNKNNQCGLVEKYITQTKIWRKVFGVLLFAMLTFLYLINQQLGCPLLRRY